MPAWILFWLAWIANLRYKNSSFEPMLIRTLLAFTTIGCSKDKEASAMISGFNWCSSFSNSNGASQNIFPAFNWICDVQSFISSFKRRSMIRRLSEKSLPKYVLTGIANMLKQNAFCSGSYLILLMHLTGSGMGMSFLKFLNDFVPCQ